MGKVLKFTPKGASRKGSLIQVGTKGYTYGVEILIEDEKSLTGKTFHPCAMPVYKDSGGEYIDFSKTRLKEYFGKIYLKDMIETDCKIPMR